MHLYTLALALFPLTAFAALYGPCTGPPDGKATVENGYLTNGICDYTTDCNARHGTHIPGGCPFDDNSITCCVIGAYPDSSVNPCGDYSACQWKSGPHATTCNSPSKWVPNKCPGYSDFECCLFG